MHLWPIPDEEALAQFYKREFYQTEKPHMIIEYGEDAEWWALCMHGPMLDTAFGILNTKTQQSPRILDIGAGAGLLLRNAQDRCWKTTAMSRSADIHSDS